MFTAQRKQNPPGRQLPPHGWRPAPPCLLHFPAWGWASASGRPPPPGTVAGRPCRGRQGSQLKPGMFRQQGDETLPHHAGGAHNADFVFFHFGYRPFCAGLPGRPVYIMLYAASAVSVTGKTGRRHGSVYLQAAQKSPGQQKNRLENRHTMQYIEYCISAQRNMPYRHDSPAPFRATGPRYDACRASPSAACPFSAGNRPGRRIIQRILMKTAPLCLGTS